MSKTWNWVIPHIVGILAALLAGPILSGLAVVQTYSLSALSLTGAAAIRLIADFIALAILLSFAVTAYRELPDNGRGSGFLRQIVLPLTFLVILINGDKALRGIGLPLVELMGTVSYLWIYSAAMVASGLWLTGMWLGNHGSLRQMFSPTPPAAHRSSQKRTEPAQEAAERSGESFEQSQDAATPLVVNGGAPTMLGRYKVLKELGRGAMGVVYLGKDPTIQRFVAIKTMRLDDDADAERLKHIKARFFREAESAGRLSHPNIVTIYDAGEQDELGYMAMEVLEGQSLKQWSRLPNLLPVAEVIQVLATVADALDYAHQQGVVHRDIKPANIMLTKDRVVKVMDFGIAKMASSSKTQTDIVLGTPTYMSPEQIAGRKVDGRSDIFSLGIVLFELLTGQPPFTADNLSALLFAITHEPPPSLASIRKDLPTQLRQVVDRALQKELPQRYRRAAEFAQDLRGCMQSLAA